MKESTLLKIVIACALVGIFIILIMAEKIDLEETKIKDITKDTLEERVKVNGRIINLVETKGLYLLDLEDYTGTIKIIVFKQAQDLSLGKNQQVEIYGRVTEYEGQLEIEAESIKVI